MNTLKKLLVFIIEDDKMYARTLQHYLQQHLSEGTEVTIYPVGEIGVMYLKRKPDYIVLDYFLDTKYYDASNGLEIAKEIRNNDPKVKLIILSGQHDAKVVMEALKIPDCEYIIKSDHSFEEVAQHILKSAPALK